MMLKVQRLVHLANLYLYVNCVDKVFQDSIETSIKLVDIDKQISEFFNLVQNNKDSVKS